MARFRSASPNFIAMKATRLSAAVVCHELGDAEAAQNLPLPALAAAAKFLGLPHDAPQLAAVINIGTLPVVLGFKPFGHVARVGPLPLAAGERVVGALIAEGVLGGDAAVDGKIDVIARLVVHPDAVLAHLGRGLERT